MEKTERTWWFLGNLLLKCFLQQSQDTQRYSDNQTKEIERGYIHNSGLMESSCWLCWLSMLSVKPWAKTTGDVPVSKVGEFFSEFLILSTAVEQLESIRGKLKVERKCESNQFFNCRSEKQSLLALRKGRLTASNLAPRSTLKRLPIPY